MMDHRHQSIEQSSPSWPSDVKGKAAASLTSRIASSASGLAKDMVGATSTTGISNSLSSITGTGSKISNGTGPSSQSYWVENRSASSGVSRASSQGHRSQAGDSFRSSPVQDSRNEEFEDFMTPGQDSFGYRHQEGLFNAQPWTDQFSRLSPLDRNSPASSGFSIDRDDGAEVRSLLSNPNFNLGTDSMDPEMIEGVEETASELFNKDYSPEERRAADRIQSSLPSPPWYQGLPRGASPGGLNATLEYLQNYDYSQMSESEVAQMHSIASERIRSEYTPLFAFPGNYVDEVWGDIQRSIDEVFQSGTSKGKQYSSGNFQLDNQALARLKMVLGHVSDIAAAQSSFSQLSFQDASQGQLQHSYARQLAPSLGFREMQYQDGYMQNEMREDATTQHGVQQSHSQRIKETKGGTHRLPIRKDSPMADQDEDVSKPTFHCPWIRCHQRFNNATELRLHTSVHTQYACPHEDCTAQFQNHEEWADHITGPHHDLLEESFRERQTYEEVESS